MTVETAVLIETLIELVVGQREVSVDLQRQHSSGRWRLVLREVELLDQVEQRHVVRVAIQARAADHGQEVAFRHSGARD